MPQETKYQSGSGIAGDADSDTEVDKLIKAGRIRVLKEPNYPGGPLVTYYRWIGNQHETPP
jgi:hypothetical protein